MTAEQYEPARHDVPCPACGIKIEFTVWPTSQAGIRRVLLSRYCSPGCAGEVDVDLPGMGVTKIGPDVRRLELHVEAPN
jgi:hypothetical protein